MRHPRKLGSMTVAAVLGLAAAASCAVYPDGGAAGGSGGGGAGGAGGGTGGAGGGAGGSGGAGGGGCGPSAPECADSCGSDWFVGAAVCEDGGWVCLDGVLVDDCPPGTCWGPPLPGESCGTSGWQCTPDVQAYASCPELMCAECTAFEGPTNEQGCGCRCDAGEVHCSRAPACPIESASNLPGVEIVVTAARCGFSPPEAQAGIELSYEVRVAQDLPGVIVLPGDSGGCAQPGPSGLIVSEILEGEGQRYCICDTGLCQAPDLVPRTLRAGSYPGTFRWNGLNWNGPSDTGNPYGPPFPPGTFDLTLRATGLLEGPEPQVQFEVLGTARVELFAL